MAQRYPAFYSRLIGLFDNLGVQHGLLPNTKDIWVRDFMPIQLNNESYVQFIFDPDYLKAKKYAHLVTGPMEVNKALQLPVRYSSIKLDGGNIIKGKSWAIVTDKVFSENPGRTKLSCITEIENALGVRVIVIPRQPCDFTGHADGIVRCYDERTVVVNRYREDDQPRFQGCLSKSLKESGLDVVSIPYAVYENNNDIDATGVYMNFLELKDFLFMPVFGLPADIEALNVFQKLYPEKIVVLIDARDIAREGGVLNCASWNVKH